MINPAQIPPEVVEAAAKDGVREGFRQAGATEDEVEALLAQRMADPVNWPLRLAQARAAIAAALATWPGAHTLETGAYYRNTSPDDRLILPLSTEARDE